MEFKKIKLYIIKSENIHIKVNSNKSVGSTTNNTDFRIARQAICSLQYV